MLTQQLVGAGPKPAVCAADSRRAAGSCRWRGGDGDPQTARESVADPGFLEGGRGGEWPKATRGVGRGSGEGLCPSPENFEI